MILLLEMSLLTLLVCQVQGRARDSVAFAVNFPSIGLLSIFLYRSAIPRSGLRAGLEQWGAGGAEAPKPPS